MTNNSSDDDEETFKPVLNPRTLKIVDRIKARRKQGSDYNLILEQREYERARKLAQKAEKEPRLTEDATPRITEMAAQLVRDGSVSDRLYGLSFKMSDMKDEKMQQKESAIHNLYEYSPRVKQPIPLYIEEEEERIFQHRTTGGQHNNYSYNNHHHSQMYTSMDGNGSPSKKFTTAAVDSILSRSEALRLRKNAKMEEILERQKAMHHPKINPVSEEIAARLPETTMQRLLGSAQKPKIQSYDTVEYTHQPQINPKSREIEMEKRGNTDISSRIDSIYQKDAKRKEKIKVLKQEMEEREIEGCTFSPNTGNRSPVFTSSFNQRVNLWERKRRAKVARERAAVVEREMKECTFSPSVKRPDSSVNVSRASSIVSTVKNEQHQPQGFEEFINRQALAREKKEQIEKGPWVTGENWKNAITVPKEFSFNQRSDVKVKSLKKPASPADVKKVKHNSLGSLIEEYEDYHGEYDDYDSDSDYERGEVNNGSSNSNNNNMDRDSQSSDQEDTEEIDVPPQGLFSAKSSISILEKMRMSSPTTSPPNKRQSMASGNTPANAKRSGANSFSEGSPGNTSDGGHESPYEEWLRRARAKNMSSPSPTKQWREESFSHLK